MHTLLHKIEFLLLLLGVGWSISSFAQDGTEPQSFNIKALLDAKNFVFKARSVSPTGGGLRQLTSDYNLTVSGDTVDSYLPYFGRAFVAPIGSEGGLRFTSKDFDYELRGKKNGRWDVIITINDVTDVRQLLFTISENGHASLQVISNNRQPISFNGIVTRDDQRR